MHGAYHLTTQCFTKAWRYWSSVLLAHRKRYSRQTWLLCCFLSKLKDLSLWLGKIPHRFSDYTYISFLLTYSKPHKPDANKTTHPHHLKWSLTEDFLKFQTMCWEISHLSLVLILWLTGTLKFPAVVDWGLKSQADCFLQGQQDSLSLVKAMITCYTLVFP